MSLSEQQNIIVQNKLILITWLPWSWKSFFGTFLATAYREIYSNLKIFHNGEQISNDLYSMEEIWKIWFSKIKWVILLDEAGVNMNSRRFMTDENQKYWELAMLGRKLNKDIIVIAQMDHTVDKNVRLLCQYHIEMKAWYNGPNYLNFQYTTLNREWRLLNELEIDLIEWGKLSWFTYSSLENSKIWSYWQWEDYEEEEKPKTRGRKF